MVMEKDVDYYLSLPYTIEVIREPDEGDGEAWFARVLELPGCMTEADSFAELGEMIQDAMAAWIDIALEDGQTIPEPRLVDDYSGKFVVRVSRSLHRELAQRAEREGVSLNAWINQVLAQGVVVSAPPAAPESTEPRPVWTRQLSDAAYRAMMGANLEVEAQSVNEELFAGWLENQLAQARASMQRGSLEEARSYLDECRIALRLPGRVSRLMAVFQQSVEMLDDAVRREWQLSYGAVGTDVLRQRTTVQVREMARQVFGANQQQEETSRDPTRRGRFQSSEWRKGRE
jgi:antitoxin HicB